jgi:DNA repair protein RecO (recombination protein O)
MRNHRQRTYRVEAIILARRDWGEADRLIVLFSLEHGKVRVVAPGARKPTSRKSGHLELFTRGRFALARGRTFDKITQAQTIDYFPALQENLERLSTAYLLAELVERFLQEEDENALLYHLLIQALSLLNQGEPSMLLLHFFELKLLQYVGYEPQLFECQLCDNQLQPVDQFFSVNEGGAICPTCRQKERLPYISMSLNTLKVLRLMQKADWTTVRRLRLNQELSHELERLLHRYIAFFLQRELKALRFMRQVRELE